MNDEKVDAALGDLDAAADAGALPEATIAALRLADVLTSSTPTVTPEFQAELSTHFDETQILELGSALALASGWQRFIEAFGIKPDQWTEATPAPQRPGD